MSIIGCTSGTKKHFARRNIDQYQLDKTVVQYFMSDIPEWANVSRSGSCKRHTIVKNINIESLRTSYSLTYEQAIQFQYMYNVNYWMLRKKYNSDFLTFADENRIFYGTSDKILADIKYFNVPKFKKISLLWIDPLLVVPKKIKKIYQSNNFQQGHPVFVSLCLSYEEISEFMVKHGLDEQNIRTITYEMFSLFNKENQMGSEFSLDFSEIFHKEQQLRLFLPNNNIPQEFVGTFSIQKY